MDSLNCVKLHSFLSDSLLSCINLMYEELEYDTQMELDSSIVYVIVAIVIIAFITALVLVVVRVFIASVTSIRMFDYIPTTSPDILILGGGTAGCVLARRLADRYPDKCIMVLERGDDLRHDRNVYRSENAINIAYTPPYSQVIASEYPGVICGISSMYGGGSSHNFGLVVQGTRELYSKYWYPKLCMNDADLNLYLQRIYSTIEVTELTPTINPLSKAVPLAETVVTHGVIPVKEGIDVYLHLGPLRADETLTQHMMQALHEKFPNVPIVNDYNAEGVINNICPSQRLYIDSVNGVRASVNRQYLPDGYNPKNLYLVRRAEVSAIDPKNLTVTVTQNGITTKVQAREETVVCLGGILSPYLLQKSGFAIPKTDNLVNHYGTQAIFAIKGIKDFASGPLAYLPGYETGDIRRWQPDIRRWQIITSGSTLTNFDLLKRQGVDVDRLKAEGYTFVTFLLFLLYPEARGRVYVKDDGTTGVDLNLFDNDIDNESLVQGMKYLYSNYQCLSKWYDIQSVFPTLETLKSDDPAKLLEAVKTGVIITDHYSCTLTDMVDSNFRLKGYPNLRVVDASTFPHITDGNTQFPAMLIGEIAAETFRS